MKDETSNFSLLKEDNIFFFPNKNEDWSKKEALEASSKKQARKFVLKLSRKYLV